MVDIPDAAERATRWSRFESLNYAGEPACIGTVIDKLPADTLLLAYQTVVRDYLPPEVARTYRNQLNRLLAPAPPGRLAWLELEASAPPDQDRPAAITAHLRGPDGVVELQLARTHWHPSSLVVDQTAASQFAELV